MKLLLIPFLLDYFFDSPFHNGKIELSSIVNILTVSELLKLITLSLWFVFFSESFV